MTKDEMAWVYAGIISVIDNVACSQEMKIKDYPIKLLNQKIINKWSRNGLSDIKEKAWKNIAIIHKELEE